MTTPTQMPESLKVPEELAAIQQALDAGPTPGPWIAGNDDDSDRFLIGPQEFPGIVCHPVVSLHAEKDADYIAACNPASMTAVLTHISALQSALKDRDAEIERLKKDAERYRWLRDEANDTPARAPMAVMVDGEFSVTWRDALYGSGLDAAIDSMKGDA